MCATYSRCDEIRSQSGDLAAYVLENIRGLDETVQYQCGKKRMDGMNLKTAQLTENQGKLNKLTGFDLALTNSFILLLRQLNINNKHNTFSGRYSFMPYLILSVNNCRSNNI